MNKGNVWRGVRRKERWMYEQRKHGERCQEEREVDVRTAKNTCRGVRRGERNIHVNSGDMGSCGVKKEEG